MAYRSAGQPTKEPAVLAAVRVARVGADVALLSWSAPVLLLLGALWVAALPTLSCDRGGDGVARCTLTGLGLLRPDLPVTRVEAPALAADEEGPRLIVYHPGHPPSRIATNAARAAEVAALAQGFSAGGARHASVRASFQQAAASAFLAAVALVLAAVLTRLPRGYQVRLLEGGEVEVEVERYVGRGGRARFAAEALTAVAVEELEDSAQQKLLVTHHGVTSEVCRGVPEEVAAAEALLRRAMPGR